MLSANYDEIKKYIVDNQLEAEGYYALGQFLEHDNPHQAYLCYENALFYSKDSKPECILEAFERVAKEHKVPRTAMVILSYNNRVLTQQCIDSIRTTTPESAREIIIIDNASKDDSLEYLRKQSDIKLQANPENEGFTKGCNQGIALADSESDIMLLNNDTVLMNNTLFWLRMGLYENDGIGAAGSVANKAWRQWSGEREGTMEYFREHASKTNIPMENPIEYRTWLVGFCEIIKRSVLNQTGVLDERYSPGNGEDLDISMRILLKGYLSALVKNSYIVHLEHASFSKRTDYGVLLDAASKKTADKYGFSVDSERYLYPDSFVELCKRYENLNDVLVLNCSMGANAYAVKSMLPNANVDGIDREDITVQFRGNKSIVNLCSYSNIKYAVLDKKYDCIVFDTKSVKADEIDEYLMFCKNHLNRNGKMIVSVENPKHFSYWSKVMLGNSCTLDLPADVVNMDCLNNALKKVGMHPTLWSFGFVSPGQDEAGKRISSMLETMSEEQRKEVTNMRTGMVVEFD